MIIAKSRIRTQADHYRNAMVIVLLLALIAAPSLQAFAQTAQPVMRTYVSGKGKNNAQCAVSSPCQTLQAAVDVTSPGGTIYVLDSANYGPLTITKSINITSDGAVAGILGKSGIAVLINAGPNDVISLRGLDVDGVQTGSVGIYFISGHSFSVQKSVVHNFTHGVVFQPKGPSSFFMSNTEVINNQNGVGVAVQGMATAVLHRVRAAANAVGIVAWGADSKMTVIDAVSEKNIYGVAAGLSAMVMVKNAVMSGNVLGVAADDSGVAQISESTLTSNGTGFRTSNGGQVQSFGNNEFGGNASDGTASATISLK